MKQLYFFLLIILVSASSVSAQCNSIKGPNLLGAKGTFSAPFITPNNTASNCTMSGSATYNPVNNIGNALAACSTVSGNAIPCSDYQYTDFVGGLGGDFRYSILKTIGDINGGNCIKGDWRAKEHTGDGGYFMAVNGAPNTSSSPIFYQIKSIPVCIGVTYEFSAWVMNVLPASNPGPRVGSEPNISFKVNGAVIVNSGPIAYSLNPAWIKVGGTFIATTNTVDLEVVNATAIASGNDLGLDDISINACQSNIEVLGSSATCAGTNTDIHFTVTDPAQINNWYKIQLSTNGGIDFVDTVPATRGVFEGATMSVPFIIDNVSNSMNGYKYRLVVASSANELDSPGCLNFNEYTLIVLNECGPTPVILTAFSAGYSNGNAQLNWQTSQEINSDHFEIFRSIDGIDFYKVANIKSAGFSDNIKNYVYQESISPQNNYYYYRLKQVDANGKAVFSSIVRLSTDLKNSIDIYPNPVRDDMAISFLANKRSFAMITIHDNTSRLIYRKETTVNKGNNAIVIDKLKIAASGTYFVNIFNNEMYYKRQIIKL